jgi:hypothetical protein
MTQLTQEQVAAIWTRINAIGCELQALSASAGTNILRRNAADLNRAHEERSAILRQELAELQSQLPRTGEASGMHLVFARTLGTCYVRASEPELPSDDGYDASDPYARYEHEVGITRDDR